MQKNTSDVSVIVANYNNGKYLDDFITSIGRSTVLPKELIIIDDGSTDNSRSVLKKYSSVKYLTVLLFPENQGFCNALNKGIETATCKYIMRVDPDDIVMPNRIKNQIDFLEEHPDIDVVGSNVIYFQSKTKKEVFTSNFPLNNEEIYKKYYSGEHGLQHPSVMIRADVMKKYKYDQNNFKAEDYEIFARIINDGHKFANLSWPQTKMRVHNKSVSSNIRYSVIERTFDIRDEIFKTKTKGLRKRFYYWYILNYKKFLISRSWIMKVLYLILAVIAHPIKFINRIVSHYR